MNPTMEYLNIEIQNWILIKKKLYFEYHLASAQGAHNVIVICLLPFVVLQMASNVIAYLTFVMSS